MTIFDAVPVILCTRVASSKIEIFLGVSDVEHLADRARLVDKAHQPVDHVADVSERARLPAVAVDGDRLACERLLHEVRDHHAVPAGLPRAHRVEQPHDDDRQPASHGE